MDDGMIYPISLERDWWPLTRLLTVGLFFGLVAHLKFGWNPHPRDLWAIPGGIAVILSFVIMLSSGLAQMCLVALMLPICGIILCNDWFYDLSHWIARAVLRLRSGRPLAVLGLCGEIILFGVVAYTIRRVLP
jgi:hypothetical protein